MDNQISSSANAGLPAELPASAFRFSRAKPQLPSVTAGLGYLLPSVERPFRYMYPPPAGKAWHNCEYQIAPSTIVDARAMTTPPAIDLEGFELWDAPTAMVDFRDETEIQHRYYGEAEELAKCVTCATHAFIFDHAVRQREMGRPALNFGRNGENSALGAVGRVHTDYSEASGQRRLKLMLSEQKIGSEPQRFAIINVWRPIGGKVLDTPLALCDARTVSAGDLAVTDLFYGDRTGEIYLVHRSPRHQWAYFSEMDRHEALVFKQYDSQVSGIARFTPHSAFDLPDVPPETPLRRSIEIRCLVTYD
jgi:hypothetical protein